MKKLPTILMQYMNWVRKDLAFAKQIGFFVELKEALEFIDENPRLCHVRKEYGDAIRIQVHQSHLIIYTIQRDVTVILRIVHGHYDWQSDFTED